VIKVKRFLGNTNTLEAHDTDNEKTNCELDEILASHRRWYDRLAEAKSDLEYDNCYWCIGG
jgi:hypothetical protein